MLGAIPVVPDEKSDPVRARPSLRAHFCGRCVRREKGRSRPSTEGRAVAVRRISRNERTRSTNFLGCASAGRSTSISNGREPVILRERGPRRSNGPEGRCNS